ncbi:MAG: GNAT family N-acetyltransferase [Pseudomonadota bacterium]
MFVRTAGERDLAAIRVLLVETWHATYDAIYGVERVTEITDKWHSVASLRSRLTRPNSEFLVADDGTRLGGVAFAESSDDGGQVTLKQLYVLPGLQGRGIGGMLLDEVIESFPEASTIRLEVEEKNTKAVAFYEANGFVRTEEVGVRARDAGNTLVFRRSLAG